ncbi:hypothetical protein D9756_007343 [Leucocoprinus leucothites]|uniref:Uncharacterized protein n=1 Tax=Leucocoprinus leucothites TaxID=201217 RepID=A0A8H5D600_9AGAR|nr:hypothetical protein D9756_007343 [Leucoagaricus leucothites]
MVNLSPKVQPSPGPGWVTLRESHPSSDGEIEIIEVKGPSSTSGVKKRKNGGEGDPPAQEGAGPSTKRARHSTFGVGRSERTSISGSSSLDASGLGNGANTSADKRSDTPPSPIPGRSAGSALPGPSTSSGKRFESATRSPSKANKQTTLQFASISRSKPREESTASALAALYASSRDEVDPSIAEWRKKKQNLVIRSPRDLFKHREKLKSKEIGQIKGKGKGKRDPSVYPESSSDSSDTGVSSSVSPICNAGVRSTSKVVAGPSTSTPGHVSSSGQSSLTERASVKSAKEQDDHGPLYVNDRRQVARKTATSLKPVKMHQFDRQLTPDDSETRSFSPASTPGADPSPIDEENNPGRGENSATKMISITRKPGAGQEPSRVLTSSIKGKEKAAGLSNNDDVITIESSEDDLPVKSTSTRPIHKSPRKSILSAVKLPPNPKRKVGPKRYTIGGTMDLTTALNEMLGQQDAPKRNTSLSQDIIDLTLDDSDDFMLQRTFTAYPSQKGKGPRNSSPALSPPITPSITATPLTTELLHHRSADDLLVAPSSLGSTPRPRSVPTISASDVPAAPRQSQSARTSPTGSSERPVGKRPILPTRRIIRSPVSDDSEVADEQEVAEAIIEDAPTSASESRINLMHDLAISSVPASSSNVSSARASPDLIPPLRRSARDSSASSADLVPLTDAESPPASPSPEPAEPYEQPSYGGFKALTWDLHRRDINNFHFKHYSSKDIPTSLPDSINRLSEYTRREAGIRDVFQAFILENICDDEAGAPEIEIINEIDAEPSPVFEFNYSNRMWYGEGVSMPDYSKLKGCDCIGRCDPKSQTCACAIKTRSYLEIDGCVYEKNGRLKHPRYPIFECNDLCSCEGDCRNRVVQHGRKVQLSVRKTQGKGWGVFNGPKRLPKGTFLGIYAGELLTDEQGEIRGRYYNTLGKSYLFDIDFWHLKKGFDPDEWHNKYVVDAYHAGNFTRFLNHSCEPNARLFPCYINEPDVEKPLLVVFSNKDIPPFEEVCFNYMGSYPEDEEDEDEDEDNQDDEPSGEKRKDAVYRPCMCGAKKCKGENIFTRTRAV